MKRLQRYKDAYFSITYSIITLFFNINHLVNLTSRTIKITLRTMETQNKKKTKTEKRWTGTTLKRNLMALTNNLRQLARFIRISFYGLISYQLIILMKLCKIRYLNLDKALLFPKNQVICLKNWKLRRAPTTKKVFWIFFILIRSWIINKSVKNEFIETRSF